MKQTWRRMIQAQAIVLAILANSILLIGGGAVAEQVPGSGVIRRASEVTGTGSWGLAGSFSGAGESWSGVDLWGDPYVAVQTVDRRRLMLSGSVCLNEHVRIGAALDIEHVRTALLVESGSPANVQRRSGRATSFSIHTEFLGDSGSRFDPR
ncbi:hypothetical protein JW848_03675, partial [Candidatus Bipolaricaulota bacterium]|nr:hypothetical protein [Candidatus Bipolaricaulota bacterium]